MNGNALNLRNTDQNLAQYMGKKKKQYKNNTCSKYQNQIRKPSESEICMASEYTTILHMIRQM